MLAPPPLEANALRNCETWDWRFLAALAGGWSAHRPSISSSAATVRLARSASIASTPRSLLLLSGNDRPSTSASTRPRTRISTANCPSFRSDRTPARSRDQPVRSLLVSAPRSSVLARLLARVVNGAGEVASAHAPARHRLVTDSGAPSRSAPPTPSRQPQPRRSQSRIAYPCCPPLPWASDARLPHLPHQCVR